MTSRPSTSARRVHDRRFVAVLAGVLALLYLETALRLTGMLPELAGEVMFGVGLTIAFMATGWFALTAPPARDDAVRWVVHPVEQSEVLVADERRTNRGPRPRTVRATA